MVLNRTAETATLRHIIIKDNILEELLRRHSSERASRGTKIFSTIIHGYDELESGEVTLTPLHREHKDLICAIQAYLNNLSDMKPIYSESDWTKISMDEIDEFRISKVFCSPIIHGISFPR